MGDLLAAARVQLRGAARGHRGRSVLERQATRPRADAPGHAGAAVRVHRDAAQQPGGLRHGVLRGRDGLFSHLAHLVVGRARAGLRLRHLRRLRLARCGGVRDSRRGGGTDRPCQPPGARRPLARDRPMSTEALPTPPGSHASGHGAGGHAALQVTGHGAGGPAPKRIVVGYGFWIFLLSDVIMFSAFFAAYAVLFKNTAGGPSAEQLFDLRNTAAETACLLASTFTCAMASLAVGERNQKWTQIALLATGLLGLAFITLEVREFASLVARGAGPSRSAFLSSFFTLVGCHGVHVTAGLLWLGPMMAQFHAKGFRQDIRHRFLFFSLFWHALDIIWVAIFSLVYLVGTLPPELLP